MYDQAFTLRDGKLYSERLAETWNTQPRFEVRDDDHSRMYVAVWMLGSLAAEVLAVAIWLLVRWHPWQ